jgi:hypothetical protein
MELVISPTRNPDLLADYYALRERTFRRELGLATFDGGEDSLDRCSDILIARLGDRCVGGARLTASAPGRRASLPLEAEGLNLAKLLPTLELQTRGYAQVTRLAVDERERTPALLRQLGAALLAHARDLGCDYLIGVSGIARSRIYRRIIRAQGLEYQLFTDVPVPAGSAFRALPHVLGVTDLRCIAPDSNALAMTFQGEAGAA